MTSRFSAIHWPRRTVVVACLVLIGMVAASCGGGHKATGAVLDHVHAVAVGDSGTDVVLATHYGLVRSVDGGRRWTKDSGLGEEMVGGLVKTDGQFVASLQPLSTPSMKMTSAQDSMPGMSMGTQSTPNIGFSGDGTHWRSAAGIPPAATVAALTAGPDASTVWASLLGLGVYQSTDGGQQWQKVIPSKSPITGLVVVGSNLLITTAVGVFVTDADAPIMPALPQFDEPVTDVVPDYFCGRCVVAAVATGGIAISGNDGVTWSQEPSTHVFDEVSSVPGAPGMLFGMIPAPGQRDHGLWRSTDGGHTWHQVLNRPLVDHLYELPGSAGRPGSLLAFQWGIVVYRSDNLGASWVKLSRIAAQ